MVNNCPCNHFIIFYCIIIIIILLVCFTIIFFIHSFAGQSVNITHISVQGLLPDTSQFMTYEGSTTMPGCHETVTWIVLNKPIYITKAEVR